MLVIVGGTSAEIAEELKTNLGFTTLKKLSDVTVSTHYRDQIVAEGAEGTLKKWEKRGVVIRFPAGDTAPLSDDDSIEL